MEKFGKQNDVELLLYLGRAFVKAQKLEDALKVLIRARHADPTQSLVLFNLSIVMQKLATQTLKDESHPQTVFFHVGKMARVQVT